MPEIIDIVFAKTSPKRSLSMTKYERFGLVFTKTRFYKFRHRNLFQVIDSDSLCSLAGRYNNPISYLSYRLARLHILAESIPGLLKVYKFGLFGSRIFSSNDDICDRICRREATPDCAAPAGLRRAGSGRHHPWWRHSLLRCGAC